MSLAGSNSILDSAIGKHNDWLVGCFGLNSPLRQYFSLYWAVSQREGERREKNVQTTPTLTYCKPSRPLPGLPSSYTMFYPSVSGEPGLVDRVLTLHAGSRGFDSHRGHMSERFFRSNRPGYPRSVTAVSLNVGGGVRLIKPAILYMCMQNTTNTTRTDAWHLCVWQWFRTAEPLGERCYENWNTHTYLSVRGDNPHA